MPAINLVLPWPAASLSPNGRDRWGKIEAVKSARLIAKCSALALDYVSGDAHVFQEETRLQISFIFHPPTHRHYDLDGLVSRCKAYQDGIFDALQNNDNQIEAIEARRKDVIHGGMVIITVSEVLGD